MSQIYPKKVSTVQHIQFNHSTLPVTPLKLNYVVSALCVCHTVRVNQPKPSSDPPPPKKTNKHLKPWKLGGLDNPGFRPSSVASSVPETVTESSDIQYNASSPDEKALGKKQLKDILTKLDF